jgi:hypothetical protein
MSGITQVQILSLSTNIFQLHLSRSAGQHLLGNRNASLTELTDMHHHTGHSFVDEFRWVSPLHYLKNRGQNAVILWRMLQARPPSLHYYCAILMHSCIVLPTFSHSSTHEYHCCQLTRQSSRVSNFYCTFKVFI